MSAVDVIGKGWSFPFRFSKRGGVKMLSGVSITSGVEKIKMALAQIFNTQIGSRVIDREFGCDLRGKIFMPITEVSAERARMALEEAAARWERRAELREVLADISRAKNGIIEFTITFEVLSTHQIGSLVWPLYVTDEMRVQNQIIVS